MNLSDAQAIADELLAHIAPHCTDAVIAGSIRREKPDVGDIEIVAIPGNEGISEQLAKIEIYNFLRVFGRRIKGQPHGKYSQWQLPSIKFDLFYATPDNFGLQLAIRTGSAKYSHYVLAGGWAKKGYHSREGILYNSDDVPTFIRTEEDLFYLIDRPWVHPRNRDERTLPNLK